MTQTPSSDFDRTIQAIFDKKNMLSFAKLHKFAPYCKDDKELMETFLNEYTAGSCVEFAYALYDFLQTNFPTRNNAIGVINLVSDGYEDDPEVWHMLVISQENPIE